MRYQNNQDSVTERRTRQRAVFFVSDKHAREGRMRRFLIVFAVALIPSFAAAHGHGGGGGGHMGGGWGGHMGGGWGGRGPAGISSRARMGAWSGHMAAWNGGRMAA